jgi:hypothetical protein
MASIRTMTYEQGADRRERKLEGDPGQGHVVPDRRSIRRSRHSVTSLFAHPLCEGGIEGFDRDLLGLRVWKLNSKFQILASRF